MWVNLRQIKFYEIDPCLLYHISFWCFFILLNQDESAARLCRQVARWIQDMFRNFYLV
jgi:hypothetical protein